MYKKKYLVVKKFISGILKGCEFVFETNVKFEEGFICEAPLGESGYIITKVKEQF